MFPICLCYLLNYFNISPKKKSNKKSINIINLMFIFNQNPSKAFFAFLKSSSFGCFAASAHFFSFSGVGA